MTNELQTEVFQQSGASLGEGPSWDDRTKSLTWVDITAGTVHVVNESSLELHTFNIGSDVGAALPAAPGSWLLAAGDGLTILRNDGTMEPLLSVLSDPSIRFNDAKCDPHGRAFIGTMAYSQQPGLASLFRLDGRASVETIFSGLTVSNGMAWSPAGDTFWFIDSATHSVSRFEFDPATGSVGRELSKIHIPAELGMPDGACIDDDGCIWVALWGGSAVHRYTPDGLLDSIIRFPVSQVTSCAIGGASNDVLFVTSARHGLSSDQLAAQPLAGSVFATAANITGRPVVPWVG